MTQLVKRQEKKINLIFFKITIETILKQSLIKLINYINRMKTLIILASLILLTNCTGGSIAKVKFGKKCTVADSKQLQESSYVWFVSSDALPNFEKRINKKNCLDS